MSLDDIGGAAALAAGDDHLEMIAEQDAPSISPARRAALEALEREFRDLLTARR